MTNRVAYCAGISKIQKTSFKVLIPELVGELVASGQGCQVPLALLVKHVYFKSFTFFSSKKISFLISILKSEKTKILTKNNL